MNHEILISTIRHLATHLGDDDDLVVLSRRGGGLWKLDPIHLPSLDGEDNEKLHSWASQLDQIGSSSPDTKDLIDLLDESDSDDSDNEEEELPELPDDAANPQSGTTDDDDFAQIVSLAVTGLQFDESDKGQDQDLIDLSTPDGKSGSAGTQFQKVLWDLQGIEFARAQDGMEEEQEMADYLTDLASAHNQGSFGDDFTEAAQLEALSNAEAAFTSPKKPTRSRQNAGTLFSMAKPKISAKAQDGVEEFDQETADYLTDLASAHNQGSFGDDFAEAAQLEALSNAEAAFTSPKKPTRSHQNAGALFSTAKPRISEMVKTRTEASDDIPAYRPRRTKRPTDKAKWASSGAQLNARKRIEPGESDYEADEDDPPSSHPLPSLDAVIEASLSTPSASMTIAQLTTTPSPVIASLPPLPVTTKASTLVQAPTLSRLGCVYNRKYDIPICLTCQAGIPLNSLPAHAYSGKIMTLDWDEQKQAWAKPSSPLTHSTPGLHRPGTKRPWPPAAIRAQIVQELTEMLGYRPDPVHAPSTSDPDREDIWLTCCLPHEDQEGPIEGVRTYPNGFVCRTGSCADDAFIPFASPIKSSVRRSKHQEMHPDVERTEIIVEDGVELQSLSNIASLQRYFIVPPRRTNIPDTSSHPKLSFSQALEFEQQNLLGPALAPTTFNMSATIHPLFADLGMVTFWESFDFAVIKPLTSIKPPRVKSKRLIRLNYAVASTFFDIAHHAHRANAVFMHLIARGAHIESGKSGPPFSIPAKARTLQMYLNTEVILLRYIMFVVTHLDELKTKSGEPLFTLDQSQMNAAMTLITDLDDPNCSGASLARSVVKCLHLLYFSPHVDAFATRAFSDPISASFAISCLSEAGSPVDITDVSHHAARMQFSIRLRGYHHLATSHILFVRDIPLNMPIPSPPHPPARPQPTTKKRRSRINPVIPIEKVSKSPPSPLDSDWCSSDEDERANTMAMSPVTSGQPDKGWWRQTALPWCRTYLTEHEPTPYGFIRLSLTASTAAVLQKRKIPNTRWTSADEVVVDNHPLNIPDIRQFLRQRLEDLEVFIKEEVLFGRSLDDLGIIVNFDALQDRGDLRTPDLNIVLGDILGTVESRLVFDMMQKDEDITMVRGEGGEIVWDVGAAEIWLAAIVKATNILQALWHMLQGSPGRASEESKMQAGNTSSRRHVLAPIGLNTLAVLSDYWKGSKKTGRFKEVLRVMPYDIARLIFILIRIIRPIMILYVAKHRVAPSDRPALVAAYRSALWLTIDRPMSEKQMRANLAQFLTKNTRTNPSGFDFPFGTRLFRQFTSAVQKKHLPGRARFTKAAADSLASTGDILAGRNAATSHTNYAVEEGTIPFDQDFQNHYINYCRKWHAFWEIETDFDPQRKYIV